MSTRVVDLRSDTVTRPTPAMRKAITDAEVGDDVLGDDPTVKRLEARVAELLGKEAALFFPSGVMANQTAVLALSRPGTEVLIEATGHILDWEEAAAAAWSGVQLRPVQTPDGLLTGDLVRGALRPQSPYIPETSLICVENTHNAAGGRVLPLDSLRAVRDVASERGIPVHLDGARLWNAAVALGTSERALSEPFDTVNVCLSKGLGAPAGSVLAGSANAILQARRYRKLLGGGMRQVGILAAAGLFAIEHHRESLAMDHARAARLATAMAHSPIFSIDPESVQTNIVIAETVGRSAADVLRALEEAGVRMVAFGPTTVRATTHRDLTEADMEKAQRAIRDLR
jgi:threonine aldolase